MSEQQEPVQPAAGLSEEDVARIVDAAVGKVLERLPERQAAEAPPAGESAVEQQLRELREGLEQYRRRAEEAELNASLREQLRRAGVANIDLAFRAIRGDVTRNEDGAIRARSGQGEVELQEYLAHFLDANPELLPARRLGGAGSSAGRSAEDGISGVELDSIRPGMNPAELERVRREVARVISQSMRGI